MLTLALDLDHAEWFGTPIMPTIGPSFEALLSSFADPPGASAARFIKRRERAPRVDNPPAAT